MLLGIFVPAYLCVVTSSMLGSQWGNLYLEQKCSLTYPCLVCICHPLSTPPASLMTGMQLEKHLATMTWKSAHLTLNMSFSLHSPHSSFTSAGHNSKSFALSAQLLLSSQHELLHSWNSWDCGDQVACEAM